MMNKVLVNIFFPRIGKYYDIWIPLNKKLYKVITLLIKGVNELNDGIYTMDEIPILYNKETGEHRKWNRTYNNIKIIGLSS